MGNRPRGRPKGSKLKKKTSRDTESAIQEASEAVPKLDATDKVEQHPKKRSRKGTKNQPPEQQPEAAVETPINVGDEVEALEVSYYSH